jgi:chemosensory pili system protein ChpA (sensor histidine kinase/response regulator)
MDVVKTEVHHLGGSISIESTLGEGVEFTIRLPFTVSVNKALLVKEGASTYALPLNSIVGVTQLDADELDALHSEPGKRLEYAGLDYQLCALGSLLYGGRESTTAVTGKAVMILVEVDHYRYAVHVEAIEGNQEIIIKGLGAQFSDVRGVAGATILASGDVVVILDLPSLLRSKGEISILEAPGQASDALGGRSFEAASVSFAPKTIMVVDDSVTVRKVTSRILEREGFRVVTAKDGIEATDMLAQVKPDLMLLDIEMPRMDGFEVARVVRESEAFAGLPIIMISSRTGEKHQQRARNLGVNKFLGKPYQEDELLGLLDELLSLDVA